MAQISRCGGARLCGAASVAGADLRRWGERSAARGRGISQRHVVETRTRRAIRRRFSTMCWPRAGAVADGSLVVTEGEYGAHAGLSDERETKALYAATKKYLRNGDNSMDIHIAGSRRHWSGAARLFHRHGAADPITSQVQWPARLVSTPRAFEPGARTAWHTHPLGQTLYVRSGVGRVQAKGGPGPRNPPGHVVWDPAEEKTARRVRPTNGMTHIAMQESVHEVLTWMGRDRRGVFRECPAESPVRFTSVARSRCRARLRAMCPT